MTIQRRLVLEYTAVFQPVTISFVRKSHSFFLVGYVEERLWWPIQCPNIERKKKASSLEDREIRSS